MNTTRIEVAIEQTSPENIAKIKEEAAKNKEKIIEYAHLVGAFGWYTEHCNEVLIEALELINQLKNELKTKTNENL